MFKRKNSLNIYSKIRIYFWPEKGFLRNFSYFWKRLIRIPDTSYSISMGFSVGFFIAFTPFFGLHFIISALISWLLKVNIFSSIVGNLLLNYLMTKYQIRMIYQTYGMHPISLVNHSDLVFCH